MYFKLICIFSLLACSQGTDIWESPFLMIKGSQYSGKKTCREPGHLRPFFLLHLPFLLVSLSEVESVASDSPSPGSCCQGRKMLSCVCSLPAQGRLTSLSCDLLANNMSVEVMCVMSGWKLWSQCPLHHIPSPLLQPWRKPVSN